MIRISNIKINPKKKDLERKIKSIIPDYKSYKIYKESVDARHKEVSLIYTVDVEVKNEERYINNKNIRKVSCINYKYEITGEEELEYRPTIVGAGPSGLFAAYFLSLSGYKPLIIERGKDINERRKDVDNFFKNGKLLENSNVQFGLGGAGLFSDGKLSTGVNDKEGRIKEVLELFVKFGACDDILYSNHPHIGTDVLIKVIKNMKEEIESLGGEFRFNSTLTNIKIENNKVIGVYINDEFIKTNILILGIGNSSRDTFKMLNKNNVIMISKPFAVGFRVVHERLFIDNAMYGKYSKYLDPASYKLTYNNNGHGVYSFCMCPGGYVINASSYKGKLTVNGMSNYKRDSKYSNSAIVVTVGPKDYGDKLFDGLNFQDKIEEKAYNLAHGLIPVQSFNDFKNNKISNFEIPDAFKGKTKISNLREILPDYLNKEIINGMEYFDTKIKGFSKCTMAGIEARTSSPIKIERDDDFLSNIKGLYPIGEGSGHSGGITTSAVDGIKCFECIIKKYAPFKR